MAEYINNECVTRRPPLTPEQREEISERVAYFKRVKALHSPTALSKIYGYCTATINNVARGRA